MPTRYAVASGNWSSLATWDGGATVPTASDDVWANNYRVFIDQDITVKTLRNHPVASPVIAAGGSFITTGSRTITCTVTNAGSGSVYGGFVNYQSTSSVLIVTGSDTVNIVSDIMGGLLPSPYGYAVTIANTGIVNITGSIAGYVFEGVSVTTVSGGTINISGSVRGNYLRGGGGANSVGMTVYVTKTINVVGDVIGEPLVSGVGISTGGSGNIILDVKGNVYTRGSNVAISHVFGTSTITITGSIYQILGSAATAVLSIGGTSCNVNVSGSITAGFAGSGIVHSTLGTSNLIGPISASAVVPGIQFSNASHNLNASGPFYNVNNRNAVYSPNLRLISGSTPTWRFNTETYGVTKTLYTSGSVSGYPATTNVRSGTVYGDINQFTGVVAIPSASNVLQGVLVDNTTGSASFNVNNAWSTLTSSLTTTGSLGARLRNVATIATDGAAIASKGKL
jgi:hypothetical protein